MLQIFEDFDNLNLADEGAVNSIHLNCEDRGEDYLKVQKNAYNGNPFRYMAAMHWPKKFEDQKNWSLNFTVVTAHPNCTDRTFNLIMLQCRLTYCSI